MPVGTNIDIGSYFRIPSLSAGALYATLVPSTSVSNYKWINLYIGPDTYVGTLTFQGSYDQSNWVNISLYRLNDFNGGNSLPSVTSTSLVLYGGPVRFPYFQVEMTAYTSGIATGTLDLCTEGLSGMQLINAYSFLLAGSNYIGAINNDGTLNAVIAAGTATDTVILNVPGFLASVLVTTLGTNQMNFYDNASAGSGTPVGIVPASSAVGTIVRCRAPCNNNGITAKGNASNPGVTVFYTPIKVS